MDLFPLGYPQQAAFQSSGPKGNFSIHRSFDYLHARVILELQDEIRCLERYLANLDEKDSSSAESSRRLRSRASDMRAHRRHLRARHERTAATLSAIDQANRPQDSNNRPEVALTERMLLLEKIRTKLVNYDDILMKARSLADLRRPSAKDYSDFRRWFWNNKPLDYMAEENFIRMKDDLITLRPVDESGAFDEVVQSCIESSMRGMPGWLSRVSV